MPSIESNQFSPEFITSNRLRHYEYPNSKESEIQEIERRYLLDYVPDSVLNHPSQLLLQGYTKNGNRYRKTTDIRSAKVEYSHVKKRGSGLVKKETGKGKITRSEFEKNWPATDGRRVEKIRTYIPHEEGSEIHLDRFLPTFQPSLVGLIIAEVEFDSVELANDFTPPDWFYNKNTGLIELTDVGRFSSRKLATFGQPDSKFIQNLRQVPTR